MARYQIDTVIDLEGDADTCIPTATNACLYIYFPIDDDNEQLPNMIKLRAIARLGATRSPKGTACCRTAAYTTARRSWPA